MLYKKSVCFFVVLCLSMLHSIIMPSCPIDEQVKKYKIGLLVVATGKYIEFLKPLLASADQHFCAHHEVTYFVFTDGAVPESKNKSVTIYQAQLRWPFATMMRLCMYHNAAQLLAEMDYLFAVDADMLFVDTVGDEIFGDLVATLHPGYVGTLGTYERSRRSTACIEEGQGKHYFCGGFNGGKSSHYLTMVKTLTENIIRDLENGIVALWHDESHLNKYFVQHEPTRILSPAYCYDEHYVAQWPEPYPPKLLAIRKNHADYQIS